MGRLENIHANLETIEEAIAQLADDKRKEIDVTDYAEFCLAVNDILGYDSTAYTEMAGLLGINASILTKFLKFRGTVPTQTARAMANRLRSYLRSLDQATPKREMSPSEGDKTARRPEKSTPKPKSVKITEAPLFTFSAEQWSMVQLTTGTKAKIATISTLLDTIIVQMKRTNAPPEHQAITDIERQQLIAVLEAALAILKTPLVEKGLLKKTYESLTRASQKAVEKQAEQGIGNASSEAGRLLLDLIKGWFS
jgi:hypothetical protein